jgi:hypothetical protein
VKDNPHSTKEKPRFLTLVFASHVRTCIICLLVTLPAMPAYLNAAPAKGVGMWVWAGPAFSTDEARQKLIQFCVGHQISHLDVYVTMSGDKEKPIVQDAEVLKDLILLAGLHNITIAALRGNPKMFFSENHERTLQELHAIIAFCKTLPAGNLFKGIKYDVEPYRTTEWKAGGESRKTAMLDYLTFLHKARDVLHEEAPRLWLAADTPFWWDKDAFVMEFEGKTKRFSEHVQDLTDFIVIMSYRRSVKKVLDCVENERRYAKEINKVIFPSLETVKLKQDPDISFWGTTSQEFWDVVPQVLEIAKADPAMGGVMIHCYRSLIEKRNNETLSETGKMIPDSTREPGYYQNDHLPSGY